MPTPRTDVPPERGEPRPLDIVQVETFGRGGLAHYADNLSRALCDLGHRVSVVTAVDDELSEATANSSPETTETTDTTDTTDTTAPKVRRLLRLAPAAARRRRSRRPTKGGMAAISRKVEALLDVARTARVVRRQRPDVVHLHCTNSILLLHVALLRVLGQTVVCTAHVVTPHETSRWPSLQRRLWSTIYRSSDGVIAHSRHDRERLIGELRVEARRIRVLPHGEYGFVEQLRDRPPTAPEARSTLGLPESGPLVLFFGYVREYKGVDVLLDAWPEVVERICGAQLAIVGDPVQLAPAALRQLEARASQLEVTTRLRYVPLEEIALWFAAADAVVLPYRRVSQSGVLYLALALGVPVVATRIGAWAEMLEDRTNSRLADAGDARSLTSALVDVLTDRALATTLRDGGRRLAELHSWPSIAQQTAEWYRSLADL